MDLGPLRALALDLNFSAHGIPVTVTLEGQNPVETRGIWLTTTSEDRPEESPWPRSDPRRVMALRRDQVPSIPRGSSILAAEKSGDPVKAWRVDGHERQEADHNRVILRLDQEATADLPEDDD